MFVSFIRAVFCSYRLFICIAAEYSVGKIYHSLLILQLLSIQLFPVSFFCFLNNAAIKITVHILWFTCELFSVVFIPRVALLGSRFCTNSVLVVTTNLTYKAILSISLPQADCECFNCSLLLPALAITCHFQVSHFGESV